VSGDSAERLLRGYVSPEMFRRGLICRSDDRGDPVVQLAPPLISTREDIDFMVAQCARSSPEPSSSPGSAPTSIALVVIAGPSRRRTAGARTPSRRRRRDCWRRLYRHVDRTRTEAARPSLRICVLEKAVCGFGASGRNGGWASALFPSSDSSVIRRYGADAFTHQRQLLRTSVGELGDAAEPTA